MIADTSGFIAASDRRAPESALCQDVLRDAGAVVVSPLVLAKVDHLAKIRFGIEARSRIMDFILNQAQRMRFQFPEIGVAVLTAARQVQHRYSGLRLDLADAVNVVLAAEYRTDAVLTLDRRDFRAIRPLTPHTCFRLLPDDL